MAEGIFPSILKVGKITSVYKKDDEQLLKYYRPISTLPIFGKMFEKIIYTRLYGFFFANGTLNGTLNKLENLFKGSSNNFKLVQFQFELLMRISTHYM